KSPNNCCATKKRIVRFVPLRDFSYFPGEIAMTFRNLILIVAVGLFASLTPIQSRSEQDEKKFEPLFNGKDLTGWKQYAGKEVWIAEDGMIICQGDGGGWLGTEKEYANFELKLEYKLKE